MPRFSPRLLEHAQYPSNQQVMADADSIGRASLNGNPPFVTIFIALCGDTVKKATFDAQGCGVTTAICSVTTEIVVGKTIDQCLALTVDDVCTELGGIPPDKAHCVHVCFGALRDALKAKSK